MTTTELVAGLKSNDDTQRANAVKAAPAVGILAVQPAAGLLAHDETEVRRAAKRALDAIVHHAGRPGAGNEAAALEKELLAALRATIAIQARRDLLWLLSEIGNNATAQAAASLLSDPDVRDDARCVLERLPGNTSLKALKDAFKQAPEDFKFALADSLRKRGQNITGYPSRRLVPVKTTTVKPGGL